MAEASADVLGHAVLGPIGGPGRQNAVVAARFRLWQGWFRNLLQEPCPNSALPCSPLKATGKCQACYILEMVILSRCSSPAELGREQPRRIGERPK